MISIIWSENRFLEKENNERFYCQNQVHRKSNNYFWNFNSLKVRIFLLEIRSSETLKLIPAVWIVGNLKEVITEVLLPENALYQR